jgi:cytochrome c oxidase subunit 4
MSEAEQVTRQHAHPTTGTYLAVAAVLTVMTLVEVGVFYIPAFRPVLAPVLLVLSATKFSLVVMFYMHLKNDSPLFTAIFTLPLTIAAIVIVALLFLFGVFALS